MPGLIGFLLAAITEDGALLINIAVFGATISYVLMMLTHIVLRFANPDWRRAVPDSRRHLHLLGCRAVSRSPPRWSRPSSWTSRRLHPIPAVYAVAAWPTSWIDSPGTTW